MQDREFVRRQVDRQTGRFNGSGPRQSEGTFVEHRYLQVAIERFGRVAENQQTEQIFYDRTLDFLIDFIQAIVVTVDVAAFFAVLQQLQIVFAGQQADIIDLRNARREALDRPRQQIGGIIVAQSRIVGAVDLIDVQVVVGFRAVDPLQVGALFIKGFNSEIHFFLGKQILHVDDTDAVMRIQGRELVARADFQPVQEFFRFAAVKSVQHQHRQSEIIDRVAFFCDFLLDRIMLMDFGKDRHTIGLQDFHCVFQHLPNFGFYEEAVRIQFLDGIGECIQADDRSSFIRQETKRILDELARRFGLHVQIDLLFRERAPDFFRCAVFEVSIHERRFGFAFVNQIDVRFSRSVLRPIVVVADEVVLVGRCFFLLQKVQIIGRLRRNVVEHELIHHVVFFADALDVFPATEPLIHFCVVHRRKAAVAR